MSDQSRDSGRPPAVSPNCPPAVSGPPPHPLDAEWHLHVDGQTYGPYSGHDLAGFAKEGRLNGASQVHLVGGDKWVRAGEDPRLAALFRPDRSGPQPPPITAAPGATVVQVTNQIPQTHIIIDDGSYGPKSAGLALFLSFLLPGAGQWYCGRVGKGFLMLFLYILLLFVFLFWIIWIWSMIDAYSTAKEMNLGFLRRLQLGQI
jgi:TM2 domain-containing membrane protein YozV